MGKSSPSRIVRKSPIKQDYSAIFWQKKKKKGGGDNKGLYFEMTEQHETRIVIGSLPEQYWGEILLELNYVSWLVNKEYMLQYLFEWLQTHSLIMHKLATNLM